MRYYSSIAVDTTLTAGISADATSVPVNAVVGYPSQFPFTIVIDQDTPKEELCDVTAIAGVTLTVTRGSDSTLPVSHDAGAKVRHVISGRDLRETQQHMAASASVHGITDTANLVYTSDSRLSDSRTPTGSAGGDLTGTFPSPTLAAAGTSGTYTKVTTDTKGRVTSGTTLSASDIPTIAQSQVTSLTTDLAAKAALAGATFTGNVTVVSPSATDSVGVRQVTISTSDPSGGSNGDVWIKYTA